MRLTYRERQTVLALSGGSVMYIRVLVTDDERAMVEKAAKQAGISVSRWAELNLVDLARIETSGGEA